MIKKQKNDGSILCTAWNAPWLSCQEIIKPSLYDNSISTQWHTDVWPPFLTLATSLSHHVTKKSTLIACFLVYICLPPSLAPSQHLFSILRHAECSSWRIHSPKAERSSHNMRSLICLIFSHLESMPRHQPCLLLSERHQSNSHWCAIIIAQMAMRVGRDRRSNRDQERENRKREGGVRRRNRMKEREN